MPDGLTIVSKKIEVSIFPATDGRASQQQTATVALTLFTGHEAPVPALAWSPSGNLLAAASGTRVRVWNVSTRGDPAFTFSGHTAPVRTVAWSPDGKYIAIGAANKSMQLVRLPYRLVELVRP